MYKFRKVIHLALLLILLSSNILTVEAMKYWREENRIKRENELDSLKNKLDDFDEKNRKALKNKLIEKATLDLEKENKRKRENESLENALNDFAESLNAEYRRGQENIDFVLKNALGERKQTSQLKNELTFEEKINAWSEEEMKRNDQLTDAENFDDELQTLDNINIQPYTFIKRIDIHDIQGKWVNTKGDHLTVEGILVHGGKYLKKIEETENAFFYNDWKLDKESKKFIWKKDNRDDICWSLDFESCPNWYDILNQKGKNMVQDIMGNNKDFDLEKLEEQIFDMVRRKTTLRITKDNVRHFLKTFENQNASDSEDDDSYSTMDTAEQNNDSLEQCIYSAYYPQTHMEIERSRLSNDHDEVTSASNDNLLAEMRREAKVKFMKLDKQSRVNLFGYLTFKEILEVGLVDRATYYNMFTFIQGSKFKYNVAFKELIDPNVIYSADDCKQKFRSSLTRIDRYNTCAHHYSVIGENGEDTYTLWGKIPQLTNHDARKKILINFHSHDTRIECYLRCSKFFESKKQTGKTYITIQEPQGIVYVTSENGQETIYEIDAHMPKKKMNQFVDEFFLPWDHERTIRKAIKANDMIYVLTSDGTITILDKGKIRKWECNALQICSTSTYLYALRRDGKVYCADISILKAYPLYEPDDVRNIFAINNALVLRTSLGIEILGDGEWDGLATSVDIFGQRLSEKIYNY